MLPYCSSITELNHCKYNQLLQRFSSQFPHVELDIITAEDEDILNLIKICRASISIVNADKILPLTLKGQRLKLQTTMSAWISDCFPLHQMTEIQPDDLREFRKLTLKTMHQGNQPFGAKGAEWTANSYLLLKDMAQEGYTYTVPVIYGTV